MEPEQIIGLVLALLIMSIGILGSFLPGLPGTPLVLLASIAHKLWFGDKGVHGWILALLALLTLFSIALDYFGTLIGAKKFGASWRGSFGAIFGTMAGVIIGLLFGGIGSLAGALIGPLAGATLMELTASRPWPEALRAGMGATIGVLASSFGKVLVSLLMMAVFTVDVVLRSWK